MPDVLLSNSCITDWKTSKQKEQLHRALLKAGFGPCQLLMGKLTIHRILKEEGLIEEFYLNHNTDNQKLLLRSTLVSGQEKPFLILHPFSCAELRMKFGEL